MSTRTSGSTSRPPLLILIVGLPLLSVLVGALIFYLAHQSSDTRVVTPAAELNKTSWQRQP